MKGHRYLTRLVIALAVLATTCQGALAAGCGSQSAQKKQMESKIKKAGELALDGQSFRAYQAYVEAVGMRACPILLQDAKEAAEELTRSAEKTLGQADELIKAKDPDSTEVAETLCACFELQIGWARHAYSGEASKRFRKLKRKLSKEARKDADREVKQLLKDAQDHLKRRDLRSALGCYDQIYRDFAFAKQARKKVGVYMRLKEMVKELDRQEEEKRKQER